LITVINTKQLLIMQTVDWEFILIPYFVLIIHIYTMWISF